MAQQTIDPGFVAAPFFGGSSYDSIKAIEQIKAEGLQSGLAAKQKQQKDYGEGLKALDLDIKGWEDEQGFEEINSELESLRENYVDLGTQGYNLYDPTSKAEQKISKAFRTKLAEIKQKHDVWQQEKATIDDVQKIIRQQFTKPEEERDIDLAATSEKINQWMAAEGGILGRSKASKDLLVGKARPVDAGKYFQAAIPKFVPGTDEIVKRFITDETTGRWQKTTWEGVDPARAKEGILKAYKTAPANIKNAVEKMYTEDPDKGVMNKEDWVVKTFGPAYPEKESTEQGTSGSSSLPGGYGIPQKDTAGNYPLQPQVRDIYYPSSSKSDDKLYPYEGVGRVPIAATFGFKNITIMGSANNMNTTTGAIEGKGKAVPAVPVEANMYPVATKAISINVKDPKTGEMIAETVKPGDRIPLHVLDQMRMDNATARDQGAPPPYQIKYKPYIHFGLSYKQVKEGVNAGMQFNEYADPTGRTQSYTETSIMPYDEVKQDLFTAAKENKQDWAPFDKYITEMENQLNSTSKINNLFEDKTKTTKDLYDALEN